MPGGPTTVARYLKALPEDRRDAIEAVRAVIRDNLDDGFAEGIQYGEIGYYVPHSVYPPGYHCDPEQPLPYIGLGARKNHLALSLFCVYISEQEQRRFRREWAKTGKKLDMGKACLRFRKAEDLALDVIARTVRRTPAKRFIARYEAMLGRPGRAAGAAPKKTAGKTRPRKRGGKAPARKKKGG